MSPIGQRERFVLSGGSGYFRIKAQSRPEVIELGVISKEFISRVCIQNMKSLSLMVQKVWSL